MRNKLMGLRKDAHLSQNQLARKLDVTVNTVGNWEKGLSLPSLENAHNMAKIFGVTTDDIFLALNTMNVVKN